MVKLWIVVLFESLHHIEIIRQQGLTDLPAQSPNFLTFKEHKNRFQPAGRYDNPLPTRFLARIDCLKIPAQLRARICRSFKETRHRFSAWRAGTKPYLSYWPARLNRLAKSIPRYRFLGSINVYKYGLSRCCNTGTYVNTLSLLNSELNRWPASPKNVQLRLILYFNKFSLLLTKSCPLCQPAPSLTVKNGTGWHVS